MQTGQMFHARFTLDLGFLGQILSRKDQYDYLLSNEMQLDCIEVL